MKNISPLKSNKSLRKVSKKVFSCITQKNIKEVSESFSELSTLFLKMKKYMKEITYLISILAKEYYTFFPETHLDKYKDIFSRLDNLSNSELKNCFSQIVLHHCENLFISPRRWNQISNKMRKLFVSKFKKTMHAPSTRKILYPYGVCSL